MVFKNEKQMTNLWQTLLWLGIILLLCSCNEPTNDAQIPSNIAVTLEFVEENLTPEAYEDFKLTYFYVGLGSNLGRMFPTFRVKGRRYFYTLEQNSSMGEPYLEPEFVCRGLLRTTSIDSIIDLVQHIEDTLIYRTNIGIMSGGIHFVSVDYKDIHVSFKLHNAHDPIAQKILDILNSNINPRFERLWLFEDFSEDY